jgi:hypothetical protein
VQSRKVPGEAARRNTLRVHLLSGFQGRLHARLCRSQLNVETSVQKSVRPFERVADMPLARDAIERLGSVVRT